LLRGKPHPRLSVLLSYLVLAGLAILLIFPACTEEATKPPPQEQGASPTPQQEQGPGTQPKEGFVFLNGRYVSPPYRIQVVDGAVQLNGEIVRPRPELPKAGDSTPVRVPAQPRTAVDLINTAALRLQEKELASYKQVTPQVRAELVALLKSFPTTQAVADQETSIVVTDLEGERAVLQLLVEPPPSLDELMRGQRDLAAEWQAMLQSGDVLLLSPGAVFTVPAHQSGAFLRDLLDAFEQPAERRLELLTQLTGVPSMAKELASVGAPPANLRDRLPPPPAGPLPGPSSRLPSGDRVGGALLSPLPDDASHQVSRTPTSNRAVFLHTRGTNASQAGAAVKAARDHGYRVLELDGGGDLSEGPGPVTVDSFLATSGNVGILYIGSHAGPTSIAIEQHPTREGRNEAWLRYRNRGISMERFFHVEARYKVPLIPVYPRTRNYTVEITPQTVIRHWKGSETIVQVSACGLFDGFAAPFRAAGAREFLAPFCTQFDTDTRAFNEVFWPRVAGTMDNGAKRNVIDAYNAVSITIFMHNGDGRTVLSPAVASHTPGDGESIPVGQVVTVTVTFDVPISPSGGLVLVSGSCGLPYVNVGRWESDRAFSFSVRALHPGMPR
jgi:hypothetical protein